MSPDARRINFIWDKDAYADLEKLALKNRMSVGELIRRTLEEKFDIAPTHPIIQIRLTHRQPAEKPKPKPKPPAKRKTATHAQDQAHQVPRLRPSPRKAVPKN